MLLLPDEAVKFINLQRTQYKDKGDLDNIKKAYDEECEKESESVIKAIGGKEIKSIMDIGCGMGGVSIKLHQFFKSNRIYLVDKNEISKQVRYGFFEGNCFYNSFVILSKIMEMNNISNYFLVNSDNDFSHIENIDLIFSSLACGFHFPIYHYIGRITDCISKDGIFICDIRKTIYEQEIKTVKNNFRHISEIKTDNPKTTRIYARGLINAKS